MRTGTASRSPAATTSVPVVMKVEYLRSRSASKNELDPDLVEAALVLALEQLTHADACPLPLGGTTLERSSPGSDRSRSRPRRRTPHHSSARRRRRAPRGQRRLLKAGSILAVSLPRSSASARLLYLATTMVAWYKAFLRCSRRSAHDAHRTTSLVSVLSPAVSSAAAVSLDARRCRPNPLTKPAGLSTPGLAGQPPRTCRPPPSQRDRFTPFDFLGTRSL